MGEKGINAEFIEGYERLVKECMKMIWKLDTGYWEEEVLLKYEMSECLEVRWEKKKSIDAVH